VNFADLQATLEQNKGPIFAAAAVGVGAFALYKRSKAQTAGATAGPGGGTLTSTGYSAGAQTGTLAGYAPGAAYDSTSADLAGYLGPQLDAIGSQLAKMQSNPSPTPVAAPIASKLFAPSDSGNFVLYPSGTVGQVQSDGSVYGLSWNEWMPISRGASPSPVPAGVGNYFDRVSNLKAGTPTPAAAKT
jgi:hypothetical protein